MTDADKAALAELHRMDLGLHLEKVWLHWFLSVVDHHDMTELERTAVHRLLMKYGPIVRDL